MKPIRPKSFASLIHKTDAGLFQRYLGNKPNLPDHMYDAAGPDLRNILETAFNITCDYFQMPTANNQCLNAVAVPIEDYLKSHQEFMGHWIGGGNNYVLLNDMATYLRDLTSTGTLEISPASFMTTFINKFADAEAMQKVFPVKHGVLQAGPHEAVIARLLGLSHILNAMVSETKQMIYPEMHHLKEGRYLYHKQVSTVLPYLAWIACMYIILTVIQGVVIPTVARASNRFAICFIKSTCNTAMYTLFTLLQWIMLPAYAHPFPGQMAILPPVRVLQYVQSRLPKWTRRSNRSLLISLKATEDNIKTSIMSTTGGGSYCSISEEKENARKKTNNNDTGPKPRQGKKEKTTSSKKQSISNNPSTPRIKKYCSEFNKAECRRMSDKCIWVYGTGCRNTGYQPRIQSPPKTP